MLWQLQVVAGLKALPSAWLDEMGVGAHELMLSMNEPFDASHVRLYYTQLTRHPVNYFVDVPVSVPALHSSRGIQADATGIRTPKLVLACE